MTIKKRTKIQQRNGDILKSFRHEINLNTKSIRNKKLFSRKDKHKKIIMPL